MPAATPHRKLSVRRAQRAPAAWPEAAWPAVYRFGCYPDEPVVIVNWTRDGLPVVIFPDGRLDVVERHRVRLHWPLRRRAMPT